MNWNLLIHVLINHKGITVFLPHVHYDSIQNLATQFNIPYV